MKGSKFIGIDPGVSGWVCTLAVVGGKVSDCRWSKIFTQDREDLVAAKKIVVEKVGGFIGVANTGSQMFAFGESFGYIKATLVTLDLEFELVTPQSWQKQWMDRLEDKPKSKEKGKYAGLKGPVRKRVLYQITQELYPQFKYPGGLNAEKADSLLLAHIALTGTSSKYHYHEETHQKESNQ